MNHQMRILILNRRDIANPAGGGAEIYTHEIARGLVEKYHCRVQVFSSRFRGGQDHEKIDGVDYIRKGNEITVHWWGFLYALKNRRKFDTIIDEFNGIGFFTFMLSNSVLLIHQLYKEFWTTELGVLGNLPLIAEPVMLKRYQKKKTITVSNSTKNDLEHLGFHDVQVVMNALKRDFSHALLKKDDAPTLTFLGRLKSTKRPEDAVAIFQKVKQMIPAAKLWVIGRGPEEEKLRSMAKGLDGVTFWGWVDGAMKMSLLERSHLLLVPGVREGFGINVIEAASAGTPAIGYDVPGLRDSIRHGETGYLVKSTDDAAARIIFLMGEKELYEKLSSNCLLYAREFDWSTRIDEFWHKICNSNTI
jgi:glycosyltransferase involved in cell wall biosynthesis